MKTPLTEEEQDYLDRVLDWEKRERKQRLFFYNICLSAGGLIILFTFLYLLENLEDTSIYWIGIPGVLLSIPFFIVYTLGLKSINEKNLIASIFKKWKHKEGV
jgi:hypothetical protein